MKNNFNNSIELAINNTKKFMSEKYEDLNLYINNQLNKNKQEYKIQFDE